MLKSPKRIFTIVGLLIIAVIIGLIIYITQLQEPPEGESVWTCGSAISYGGDTYSTVLIGSQCWMAENLNVTNGNTDQTCTTTRYCYDDNSSNCDIYGGLYAWSGIMCGEPGAASNPSGVQGICPNGWHIPSDDEWKELEGEVDSTYPYGDIEWDSIGHNGDDVGRNLKEDATQGHWNSDNGACNSSGFAALPAGYRHVTGSYNSLGRSTTFWSSTLSDKSDNAWYCGLVYSSTDVVHSYYIVKNTGFSVRCLKD